MSSNVGHMSSSTRSTINMASISGRGMPFVQTPQTNGRRIRVATCGATTRPSGVSLFDAMKFNGPAPELVNARLAMVGILQIASLEASTGQDAIYLLTHPAVQQLLLDLLILYASFVPVLKGAKSEPFGVFTPKAEITNGRLAMLGFAALLYLEHKAGGVPFF